MSTRPQISGNFRHPAWKTVCLTATYCLYRDQFIHMIFRKLTLVLFCCFIFLFGPAQTFYKNLRLADNSVTWHRIRNMTNTGNNEIAVITTNHFYRIDNKGAILLQKRLVSNEYTLFGIRRAADGNFFVAGKLSRGSNFARVWKIDANGNILQQNDLSFSGEINEIKLVPGNNNHLYLACSVIGKDEFYHAELMYLNEQLTQQWHQVFSTVLDKEICLIPGENGGVELQYCTQENMQIVHHKVSSSRQISDIHVNYIPTTNLYGQIRRVIKTADGGYLYSGVESNAYFNTDLVLIKTSSTGNIEWQVSKNLYLGDIDMDLAATGDGYLLAMVTGYPRENNDYSNMDMALLKVDLSGQTSWCKAYGTVDGDQATGLVLMNDGGIVLGGYASIRSAENDPVIIKTDANGQVEENRFPYQVENPSLITMTPDEDRPLQNLIGAAMLPDGGMILGTSIRDPETDVYYPYISRSDATGKILWHKVTPDEGIQLTAMKGMPDGSFITAATGLSTSFITRFDENGNTIWSKEANITSVQDIIRNPDGGYFLCGHRQEASQINLCVILLNNDGEEQWSFIHHINQQWLSGRSVVLTKENDLLVTGFAQYEQEPYSNTLLAKIDTKGRLLWYKTFPYNISSAAGNQVIVTSDNQYLITGLVRTYGGGEEIGQQVLLIKTNAAGTLIWEKQFDLNKLDAGVRLFEHAGNYYIAGNTGRPSFGTREAYGFLMKTDQNGTPKGISYFGQQAAFITCTNIFPSSSQNKLYYVGTLQEPFDKTRPFRTELSMDVVLSVNNPDNEKNIKIYPVPATGNAFIDIDNSYNGQVRLSIHDITGKQVYQNNIAKNQQHLSISIPVSNYPKGMYFVELSMGKQRVVKKLLIGQ